MNFLLVCGGTAGHINPALAIAGRLKELFPESKFLFVGAGREMENRLIPAAGFEIRNVTITGFSREISLGGLKRNYKMVRNLYIADQESKEILETFKPDIVIGTGGYVCYPVLKRASKMKIPTMLHESNAIPGLTTKMLCKRVEKIMVAFPGISDRYSQPEKVVYTGTPVRADFAAMTKEEARTALGLTDDRPFVVSFWGSLGASKMNEIMADFIVRNHKAGSFHHMHATGGGEPGLEKMYERLRKRGVDTLNNDTILRAYIDNMGVVMTAADVVLCRAGASTIAELTAMGKPSVLVPSPNVTNHHQEKNAAEIDKAGGAKMLLEPDCTGDVLYDTVQSIVGDSTVLERMSKCAAECGKADACEEIVKLVLSRLDK